MHRKHKIHQLLTFCWPDLPLSGSSPALDLAGTNPSEPHQYLDMTMADHLTSIVAALRVKVGCQVDAHRIERGRSTARVSWIKAKERSNDNEKKKHMCNKPYESPRNLCYHWSCAYQRSSRQRSELRWINWWWVKCSHSTICTEYIIGPTTGSK